MYKLVEVTPEEYVILGGLGAWVWATDSYKDAVFVADKGSSKGDGSNVDILCSYTKRLRNGRYFFKHYYTRVEQEQP